MILDNLSYVATQNLTGYSTENIYNFLIANNKNKTFEHIKKVAETSAEIAVKYNLDVDLCMQSGYLHDISTVILASDMLLYARNSGWKIDPAEERHPFLLHQRCSAVLTKELFSINDEMILNAVSCHTTLKENPSQYDLVLFIADKLSWDQEGQPPFWNLVKSSLETSLEKAALDYINYTLDNGLVLYPHRQLLEAKKWLEKIEAR